MTIGIIGNGYHSKRIQSILKKKKKKFFIYKPSRPSYYDKSDFHKLKNCKRVFIITPNNTHLFYIKKLYKNRYIFCEKPPVSKIKDFNNLKKINSSKLYFNFNFRFLKISEAIKKAKLYNFGKLLLSNIVSSHGLALKKEYEKSWRSDKKKCPKGVFEIVSIHWIDLINFHFGIKKINKPKLQNFSGVGDSFDTSSIEIILKNNSVVNIFSTYNSAYSRRLLFLFENGIIEQIDDNIRIYGPARNFDKKGFFIKPRLIKLYKMSEKKDYNLSLKKSINFFLKVSNSKRKFDKKLFNYALESNKLIF